MGSAICFKTKLFSPRTTCTFPFPHPFTKHVKYIHTLIHSRSTTSLLRVHVKCGVTMIVFRNVTLHAKVRYKLRTFSMTMYLLFIRFPFYMFKVKLFLCLFKRHAFLTSELLVHGGEWSTSRSRRFAFWEIAWVSVG
jgi:hypothetical protein